jgi:hypothetical protein
MAQESIFYSFLSKKRIAAAASEIPVEIFTTENTERKSLLSVLCVLCGDHQLRYSAEAKTETAATAFLRLTIIFLLC